MRVTRSCLLLLLLALWCVLPHAAEGGDSDPESRLADAWHALRVDRRPEDAARLYRALLEDDAVPVSTKARAYLGLARAERLLGHPQVADGLLREVLARYPELHVLQAEVRGDLAPGREGTTHYATGTVSLALGHGLDLDTGGVFPGLRTWLGGGNEVWHGTDGLALTVDGAEDPSLARLLRDPGPDAWRRVVTDEGRTAWVQVTARGPEPLVRFVTRVRGSGPLLGDAGRAFCLGHEEAQGGDRIEVWFEPREGFTHYRVEARSEPAGTFHAATELSAPPYLQVRAERRTRYTYRITGLDALGNEGIPTSLAGTTTSRGVHEGVVDLRRGQAVDLLTEEVYDASLLRGRGGDIVLINTYGGNDGAGFHDAWGRVVPEVEPGRGARSVWDATYGGSRPYIEDDGVFVLPLRGGGVARGRVEMLERRREPGAGPQAEVRIHYLAYPDGPSLPPAPVLETQRTQGGVRIDVRGLELGSRVEEVEVRRPGQDEVIRRVRPGTTTGSFLDAVADENEQGLLEYRAVPVGRGGRRGVAGSVLFDGRPKGIREGTFRFHYHQGWSFARGEVVPQSEADVYFESCAGGISSIRLAARGGIANLEDLLRLHRSEHTRDELFQGIEGVDPETFERVVRKGDDARGDRRRPAADVFVLRLRRGGWAKLAIVEREDHSTGGWQEKRATVRFSWNPHGPRLSSSAEPGVEAGPLRMRPGLVPPPATGGRGRGRSGGAGESRTEEGPPIGPWLGEAPGADVPDQAPAAWLKPYRADRATLASLDRLRTDLLRAEDDAFVVRGLSFLALANDRTYRRVAATALGGAYLLGKQTGADAAPALRRLARDPDPWTRYHAIASLQLHDTPLRRALLLRHVHGEILVPKGEAWDRVRDEFRTWIERTAAGSLKVRLRLMKDPAAQQARTEAEEVRLRALVDPKARKAWVDAAPDRPAGGGGPLFVMKDLTLDEPTEFLLSPSAERLLAPARTLLVTATGLSVLRSEAPLYAADFVTVKETPVIEGRGGGGYTATGGARPYGTSRSASGSSWSDTVSRVVSGDRVRVWMRHVVREPRTVRVR